MASAATTASEANSQGSTFSQQLGVLYQLDEKRKKTKSRLRFEHGKVEWALAQLATVEGAREKGYQSAMKQIDKEQAISRDTRLGAHAKSYDELREAQLKESRELGRLQQKEITKQDSDQIRERCEKEKKCQEESRGVTRNLTEAKKIALAECSRLSAEISTGDKVIKIETEKLATLV